MLFQSAPGRRLGLIGQGFTDIVLESRQIIKPFSNRFGEVVIDGREVLLFHRPETNLEIYFFTSILFSRVIFRNRNGKLTVFLFLHSDQIGGETRKRKYVLFFRHVLHVLVFHHDFLVDYSVDINVETVAILHRAVDWFPHCLFLPDPFNHAINVFSADFRCLRFDPNRPVISQVNRWFQRDRGRKRNRLHIRYFDAWFGKSIHVLILQNLVQGFRNQEFQRFLNQRSAADHPFYDISRGFTPSKPRNIDSRNGTPI